MWAELQNAGIRGGYLVLSKTTLLVTFILQQKKRVDGKFTK